MTTVCSSPYENVPKKIGQSKTVLIFVLICLISVSTDVNQTFKKRLKFFSSSKFLTHARFLGLNFVLWIIGIKTHPFFKIGYIPFRVTGFYWNLSRLLLGEGGEYPGSLL